jgi:hypothetical protein
MIGVMEGNTLGIGWRGVDWDIQKESKKMMGALRGKVDGLIVWEGLEGVKSLGTFKSTMGGRLSCKWTSINTFEPIF